MADATIKAGDTWPPLRGTAGDSETPVFDLIADAESMVLIIKHTTGTPLLEVTPTAIDPGTNDGFNWEYVWQDTDTDVIGDYSVELEITWDSAAIPPQVQTVPSSGFNSLEIVDDLGGDR